MATIRRLRWSAQMTMKKNIKWSFQPALWLSSAEEEESSSTNSSQVGVALFPSF